MVGRSIEAEYPQKRIGLGESALLSVAGFSGGNFRDISFALQRGEILGFAGAEGNGQRDAIRALGGLQTSTGSCRLRRQAGPASARRARRSTPASCPSAPTARRNRSSPRSASART